MMENHSKSDGTKISHEINANENLLQFYQQYCSPDYPIDSPQTFFILASKLAEFTDSIQNKEGE